MFLAVFLVLFFFDAFSLQASRLALPIMVALLFVRSAIYFVRSWSYYRKRVNIVTDALVEFKKGHFLLPKIEIEHDDELSDVYHELRTLGKHLDSIYASQKQEIEKFNEVYNSIIFSMSSYFIVLNEYEKIVFATENFCNKFQFDQDDIKGKRIDDIFYFVNARLKGGIRQARETGESIILEKTHLLSINKVSIISDIKISSIIVQGRKEIILLIDDVTSKLRKDYQISLMNQISESIQRDAEIERVLYTILTGVTSGSGLGFNRPCFFSGTGAPGGEDGRGSRFLRGGNRYLARRARAGKRQRLRDEHQTARHQASGKRLEHEVFSQGGRPLRALLQQGREHSCL
jgi:hypothetical protein